MWESAELQAVILAMKGMDRELAKQIRQATKSVSAADWTAELAHSTVDTLEQRVLVSSARVAVSDQNVTLKSGGLSKKLSGGAKVFELTHHVEFGADRSFVRGGIESSRGALHKRHTRRQFKPRNTKGRVVYPAAARIIPRLAALWVQTTVRTFHEAIESR